MNKFNLARALIVLAFFCVALGLSTLTNAAEPAPRKIALNCDGYIVKLHNSGIVRGTISFESGHWTELYINGAKKQPDDVLLLNPSTLRLAVLGSTHISGVKRLVLRIYASQLDYNTGFAQHNLVCRKLVDGK